MTEESAAEYITSVPFGAITGASPAEKLRKRRSNGLRLEASIRAILTPAPRLLISPSTVSRLKPSRRLSASGQVWASTGTMNLWRVAWTPYATQIKRPTHHAPRRPFSTQSALANRAGLPCQLSKAPPIPSISRNKTFKSGRRVGLGANAAVGVVRQRREFPFG